MSNEIDTTILRTTAKGIFIALGAVSGTHVSGLLTELADEIDALRQQVAKLERMQSVIGYPVCREHTINDYTDLRGKVGCPMCLQQQVAELAAENAKLRAKL